MKRIRILIMYSLILLILVNPFGVKADEFYEGASSIETLSDNVETANPINPPGIDAGAAIVIDMESGRVLYEKNAYSKRSIASTTKIMTAIVALENGNIDDMVTVSKRATSIWGSTIHLNTGDKYSLRDLLYGLLLNSGNDAAIAIAEHIGGSVENFAEMMNKKAKEIGAKNTNFITPHGLDTPEHYSTAYDLALITKYALTNKTFSRIVGTLKAEIPGRSLYNTNEMLELYPGADGVKTGYTGQAGRCLVASATRDKWRIISVVLNCGSRSARAQSTKRILDYAFDNYKMYALVKINETIARIPVIKGVRKDVSILPVEEIHIPLRADEVEALQSRIDLPETLQASVDSGIEVGSIEYLVNGKMIAQTGLKTGAGVRRKMFMDYLGQIFTEWVKLVKYS